MGMSNTGKRIDEALGIRRWSCELILGEVRKMEDELGIKDVYWEIASTSNGLIAIHFEWVKDGTRRLRTVSL